MTAFQTVQDLRPVARTVSELLGGASCEKTKATVVIFSRPHELTILLLSDPMFGLLGIKVAEGCCFESRGVQKGVSIFYSQNKFLYEHYLSW